ncbi:ProA [Desulforapulum autotrophicum HRM2]|uniref:Gamma-glutamyl phosphate reductase n=1 Tax=Desulforapulum autotrophicum (strain ATCC 43914 / DSM 3382 / VKM B-1955 / HRM2) TaxID=177437 RepID=PROA_DESAH|nr:glutamate-5-semialdehyde dehydrogenase [Desulforapulum autotrophicum]C0QLF1.1 RecName: Full=Gamma-glutamyl phosphate reductase; Short=GPR; AltName: Full=Glutamate-5-semialdehyde dehydrogenase; AltName: Full=Glutamyl-gamma-semialdehyde dehydrogenase; Short=GSA dehydrogenase [Desulforapulum autotrophicum HRM2]ACN16255.1 ProA [Desulforapulum autotrophicum HRM2]
MTLASMIEDIARRARTAARPLATASADTKNTVLAEIARGLAHGKREIEAENQKDLKAARDSGMSAAMIDRLTISDQTLESMIKGLNQVIALPDPVGRITGAWTRPNGLEISKRRIPLGVIAMIYESRPNVTVDAAALCLKAGNAAILRGGSEAFFSNTILARIIGNALETVGISRDSVQVLPVKDRQAITELLQQEAYIDLVIPRGGESLIRFVVKHSTIPVLKHYKGVCHVYVDETCNMDEAVDICINAKTQRPGVCNAMETLLVHERIAPLFLPRMAQAFSAAKVEMRGCPATLAMVPQALPADETDWSTEYLDLIVSVKIVKDLAQAMAHIAVFGSDHTDVIVTDIPENAETFINTVSSSMVGVNVSTRFNDGGELGLGAEIGISTSRLHAFGPMGLEELTSTKFVVVGKGQTRQ